MDVDAGMDADVDVGVNPEVDASVYVNVDVDIVLMQMYLSKINYSQPKDENV